MTSKHLAQCGPVHSSGDPVQYPPARGRYAPRQTVESLYDIRVSVVSGRPSSGDFIQSIRNEMKIRKYQANTIKDYCNNLIHFLKWFGGQPHQVEQSDVKSFLLYLADAGRSASTLNGYLAAIRTAFDKMCLRNVTLGIVTPRKPKALPVVLSRKEIQRLLESAPTLEDKLILGLMYACGMRVSEVSCLRYRDVDFDRRTIMVRRGKGMRDRPVILPETFRPLLATLAEHADGDDFLFPGRLREGRYVSPRTIQRMMKRAVLIAGIKKGATPHSLRHSFATHTFEDGCDIRNIQKLLGHVHLETTTIYIKVARPTDPLTIQSPLDRLSVVNAPSQLESSKPGQSRPSQPGSSKPRAPNSGPSKAESTLQLSFHFQSAHAEGESDTTRVTIGVRSSGVPAARPTYLTGIQAVEIRDGWFNLQIPALERWEPVLSRLSLRERTRIESPEFFALIQSEIADRLRRR